MSDDALASARSAQLVFEGKATAVSARKQPSEGPGPAPGFEYNFFEFEISRTWKGPSATPRTIKTAMNSAACGIPFALDASYLVYAQIDDQGQAYAGLCSRTRRLDSAQAKSDLEQFAAVDGAFDASPTPAPHAPAPQAPAPQAPAPLEDPQERATSHESDHEVPRPTAKPIESRGCTVSRHPGGDKGSGWLWALVFAAAGLGTRNRAKRRQTNSRPNS